MAVRLRPLTSVFGAEVTAFERSLKLDMAAFEAVREAWLKHSLLLFRNVDMTPMQHVVFTRRLGELFIVAQQEYVLPGMPEIFVISNKKTAGRNVGMRKVGLGWHSDGEDQRVPNAGSLLYGIDVPPEGGDTYFCGLYAVYDALPERLKLRIAGRKARFSRVALHGVHYPDEPPLTPEQVAARPDVFRPLVHTHHVTKRKSLCVGRWACGIEGMPDDEAKSLLKELLAFATQPQFVYRHRWQSRDVLLWDNRCLLHKATEFDEGRFVRYMHRTTLRGGIDMLSWPERAGAATVGV